MYDTCWAEAVHCCNEACRIADVTCDMEFMAASARRRRGRITIVHHDMDLLLRELLGKILSHEATST